MDWKNLTADKNMFLTCHYYPGRSENIDRIIIHHNAANLTTEGCYQTWQTREASAHYQVESNGTIGQLVHDYDTAWHCPGQNSRSIGIEHANNNFGPWTVSNETLESGAHLVAALCLYYKLGRPQWGKNVFGHKEFMATACPGELGIGGSQHDKYCERMGAWYDAMAKVVTEPTNTPQKPETQTPKPSRKQISVDGKWGIETTKYLQEYFGLYVDGIISGQNSEFKDISRGCLFGSFEWINGGGSGSPTIKKLQQLIGTGSDGYIGPKTWHALIDYGIKHGSGAEYNDSRLDDPSVTISWLQSSLNKGKL